MLVRIGRVRLAEAATFALKLDRGYDRGCPVVAWGRAGRRSRQGEHAVGEARIRSVVAFQRLGTAVIFDRLADLELRADEAVVRRGVACLDRIHVRGLIDASTRGDVDRVGE